MTPDLTALQDAVRKLAEILRECCILQRDDAVANQLFPLAVEWRERMDQCKAISAQFAEPSEEQTPVAVLTHKTCRRCHHWFPVQYPGELCGACLHFNEPREEERTP